MGKSLPVRRFKLKYSLLCWLILPALFLYLLFNYLFIVSQPQAKTLDLLVQPTKAYSRPLTYARFDTKGKGAVTILFNSAWKSQYNLGFAYLKSKGIKGSISVTSDYIKYPGYWNWLELQEAQSYGWEIISQGKSYQCDLSELSDDQILDEVKGSKQEFFNHGIYTQHFASPCGIVELRLTDQVVTNYKSQKIGEEGINLLPLTETYLLKGVNIDDQTTVKEISRWIDQAKKNNGWIIFVFDQIEDEMQFKKITDQILASKIPLVIPSQIVD